MKMPRIEAAILPACSSPENIRSPSCQPSDGISFSAHHRLIWLSSLQQDSSFSVCFSLYLCSTRPRPKIFFKMASEAGVLPVETAPAVPFLKDASDLRVVAVPTQSLSNSSDDSQEKKHFGDWPNDMAVCASR